MISATYNQLNLKNKRDHLPENDILGILLIGSHLTASSSFV